MPPRVLCVVLASLVCLAVPHALYADPVRITSGLLIIPGTSEVGSLEMAGTRGFTLRGNTDNVAEAFTRCFDPDCVPGTPLGLFVNLGGPTLLGATITVDGVTYPDVDTLNSPVFTNMFFRGNTIAPAMTGVRTTITTPFTYDGTVFLDAGNGVSVELLGSGVATLRLVPYGLADFPDAWRVDQIDYLFVDSAPVPEPGTMTLAATALAGAWMARRRARRREHSPLESPATAAVSE
jgi:hypothetical protein